MRKLLKRGEELLEKYQLCLLVAQILVLTGAMIFLARNRAMDWDEAYTFNMVSRHGFADMLRATAEDIHPPLYYIVLWLVGKMFGYKLFVMKLCTILFTVLTMLLGITLVRKNWGWKAAAFWNLAIGMGPFLLFYSLYIRMYSLSLFCVTFSALLAYEILKYNRRRDWVLFVISSLAGVYTHYFTAIPLAVIYAYLLIGILVSDRKRWKDFLWCCVATIVGYLPWISVVISTFTSSGVTKSGENFALDFRGMLGSFFGTGIEFSAYMPAVLMALGVIILFVDRNRYTLSEKMFLGMCVSNLWISYLLCRVVSSFSQHFWADRYILAAAGVTWLFLAIIFSRQGWKTYLACGVWLACMCWSSFGGVRHIELGTVDYLNDTYRILEQVRGEKQMIYNYETYDTLYSAHLPDQEFLWYSQVDFDSLEGDSIYMISWGGEWFDPDTIEKYNIRVEECGTMRFEEGMGGIKLLKLYFDN